jgi:hypothetical protein
MVRAESYSPVLFPPVPLCVAAPTASVIAAVLKLPSVLSALDSIDLR